jgi:hypothetical protein
MSPERGRYQISFEEVISNAKEIMFRDGNHVPILIVESGKTVLAGQILEMPETHGERLQLMRFLGQVAATSGRVDQVQQVFMVSEGWMSMPSEDKPSEIRPSQDPSRKEVLIISAIQMTERKKQMEIFEILRDSSEQVVSLERFLPGTEKKDGAVDIPLLDAFVHGFQEAFRIRYN